MFSRHLKHLGRPGRQSLGPLESGCTDGSIPRLTLGGGRCGRDHRFQTIADKAVGNTPRSDRQSKMCPRMAHGLWAFVSLVKFSENVERELVQNGQGHRSAPAYVPLLLVHVASGAFFALVHNRQRQHALVDEVLQAPAKIDPQAP